MKFVITAHGAEGQTRYVGMAHSKEEAERWGAKYLANHPTLTRVTLTNTSLDGQPSRDLTLRGAKTLLTRRGLARGGQSR